MAENDKKLTRRMTERHRASIRIGELLSRLNRHIEDGEKQPMTATQLKAAQILLDRALPPIQAIQSIDSDDDQVGYADIQAAIQAAMSELAISQPEEFARMVARAQEPSVAVPRLVVGNDAA